MSDSLLRFTESELADLRKELGELPAKGPRSFPLAVSRAILAMTNYQRRLQAQRDGQTFEARRKRLQRIELATIEITNAIREAGPECWEELDIVGRCIPVEFEREGDFELAGDLAGVRQRISPKELPFRSDQAPEVINRLNALLQIVQVAIGNQKLKGQSGYRKKPATLYEASPSEHLVNEVWDLLEGAGRVPNGGLMGPLNQIVLLLAGKVEGTHAKLDRFRRQLRCVQRLRRKAAELESAFDEAWDREGGLGGTAANLQGGEVERLANDLIGLIEKSNGLLRPSHRLSAWQALHRHRGLIS